MVEAASEPRRVRVALVHDLPSVAARIDHALRDDDRIVVVAREHAVATARARIRPGAVDVAVIDAHLADGHGVRLGVLLRRNDPNVAVVLISGRRAPELLVDLPIDVRERWSWLGRATAEGDPRTVAQTAVDAAAGRVLIDPVTLAARHPRVGSALARLGDDARQAVVTAASSGDDGALRALLAESSRG